MNIETGGIVNLDDAQFAALSPKERAKHVPVMRSLTVKERATSQIALYSPCGCGSGKKFKFCCHRPAS